MKIVNFETFRKLPPGTIYCKYEPQVFRELEVKDETLDYGDFLCACLTGWVDSNGSDDTTEILYEAEKTGESFDLEVDCYGRDGMFEEDQLFAVYEKKDVEQLIQALQKSLKDAYDTD